MPKFLVGGTIAIAVVVGLAAIVFSYTDLEPHHFRIFGFSEDRFGGNSLTSRVRILTDNFLTQFAYNPVFGNLEVDSLTTGKGSYAHSLVSLLTHLGIAGTSLFVAYLIAIFRELKRPSAMGYRFYNSTDVGMFSIVAFGIILCFASVGTFFHWMPLWFSLGLLFPPLFFRRSTRRCKQV
jgi:hypothetical protein